MTDMDLRRLLDETADDTTRTSIRASAIIALGRRTARRRRLLAGVVAGGGVAAALTLVAVLGLPAGAPADSEVASEPTPSDAASTRATPTLSGPATSCDLRLQLDGTTYVATRRPERTPAVTGQRLPVVVPACSEAPGAPQSGTTDQARPIVGVPIDTAVWLDGHLYVAEGARLPALADALFVPLTCRADGPRVLTGRWLGVTTRRPARFDGDLRAPLTVELMIGETRPRSAAYEGYTIRIRDDGGADPALTPEAAELALGGRSLLEVSVHCEGERFVADGFSLVPA
ncbi:MAG: hypothetical protein OSB43_13885 [Nocardioides sp.]|uniref:hypothetical protein n=1 Tax=Nocardioides sp. TaxID=35761 RepID=UPI0023A2279E|nr:hypothetical protein [Nocardioides sp.]MDE0777360.1 hypothetical protein [Nocardioides sp.]